MEIIPILIIVPIIIFCICMLFRNSKIYNERQRVLKIAKQYARDGNYKKTEDIFTRLEQCTYDNMLHKPFTKVDSFYKDIKYEGK